MAGEVPLSRVERVVRHEGRVHTVSSLRVLDVGLGRESPCHRFGIVRRIDRDDVEGRVGKRAGCRPVDPREHGTLRGRCRAGPELDDDAAAEKGCRAGRAAGDLSRPLAAWRARWVELPNAAVDRRRRDVREQHRKYPCAGALLRRDGANQMAPARHAIPTPPTFANSSCTATQVKSSKSEVQSRKHQSQSPEPRAQSQRAGFSLRWQIYRYVSGSMPYSAGSSGA